MLIMLKGVRVFEGMSEETTAFLATVYVDGKKLTTVKNDGRGGSHCYGDYRAIKVVDDYAKSLPPKSYSFGAAAVVHMPQCADSLIDDALNDYLLCRDIRKAIKTRLIVLMPDGTLVQGRKLPPVEIDYVLADKQQLAAIVSRWGGVACFNTMPIQDQVKAWIHNSGE